MAERQSTERNILTVSVEPLDRSYERVRACLAGQDTGDHYTFPSMDALFELLTPERFQILEAMSGRGGLSADAISGLVTRDGGAVTADLEALVRNHVIERTADGYLFPYDGVHVDFTIGAAAA